MGDAAMALLPPQPTHLVVRWLHVLAMATLLGGGLLCWWTLRRQPRTVTSLPLLAGYERLFWGAAGLAVLTGVGNLGALAPGIPGPATAWGSAFAVKLAGVVALLLGSVARTAGVIRLRSAPAEPADPAVGRLRLAYATTAILLFGVVALAEVLAHG